MGTEAEVRNYADEKTPGPYVFPNFIINEINGINLLTIIEVDVVEDFEKWGDVNYY